MMFFEILCSVPKTVYFNFRYLPCRQAIKLPIWLIYTSNVKIMGGGKIIIRGDIKTAMIRIGFHKVPIGEPREKTVLNIERGGKFVFKGSAHIGHGSKIHVASDAELILGDNFAISASSQLNCYKKILFGRDIQFSWDCLVMDSDTHKIVGKDGNIINEARDIVFGDKIWIGCRSTILKGSVIPSNCVIGACSLVSGDKFEENTIIAGTPAKSIKKISNWIL